MAQTLNILQLCRTGSRALGPGLRYVIWVQGCPFHCPHCETPEGRSFDPNIIMDVDELAEDVISRTGIEGITISGGEPFEQANALAAFLRKVHEVRPELTVISYTGYQYEQLTSDSAKAYLSELDLLIDGHYVHELNDNKGIRGSSNQRLIFLSERLRNNEKELIDGKRKLEIVFQGSNYTVIGLLNIKIDKNEYNC